MPPHSKPSSRRRKPYTRDSLVRALAYHKSQGAVRSWRAPEAGQPTFRIELKGQDMAEYTEAMTYAICLGLAAGERAYRTEARPTLDVEHVGPGVEYPVIDGTTGDIIEWRVEDEHGNTTVTRKATP